MCGQSVLVDAVIVEEDVVRRLGNYRDFARASRADSEHERMLRGVIEQASGDLASTLCTLELVQSEVKVMREFMRDRQRMEQNLIHVLGNSVGADPYTDIDLIDA